MEDFNREGVTFTKIQQLFRLLLPKNTKTLHVYNKFTDFDPKEIKKKYNIHIKGIILDVDETISLCRGKILPQNVKHLDKLIKQGLKIVLMSNMIKTGRYDVLNKKIKVMTNFPPKPEPKGFKMALKELAVPRENIVMIGDNYITDGGAIQLNIPFVRVKPIPKKHQSFPEFVHSFIRRFFIILSRIYHQ